MDCDKDFAVVFFENENIYSEIPVSWLTSDRKQCWWPNIMNPRSRMIRGDHPNNDDTTIWSLHDIKLESFASTLESARKTAEDSDYATGNEELVLGQRQRKTRNYDSSSTCSDGLTPPPSPKNFSKTKDKKKASKKSLKIIKSKINKETNDHACAILSAGIRNSPVKLEILAEEPTEGSGHFSRKDLARMSKINKETNDHGCAILSAGIRNSPVMVEVLAEEPTEGGGHFSRKEEAPKKNDNSKTSDDIPVLISKENPATVDLQDIHREIQQLVISCNAINKFVISIDKRLKALTLEKGNLEMNDNLEALMSQLPCKTNEDVENLDQNVTNSQEFKNAFVQYIKRIGGKDLKDNINRSLPCLFTNELGTRCSYVGFRGNFKLQNFAFMKLFVEIVMLQHQCTIHEVEKNVGEWFRLSNQRQKRQQK